MADAGVQASLAAYGFSVQKAHPVVVRLPGKVEDVLSLLRVCLQIQQNNIDAGRHTATAFRRKLEGMILCCWQASWLVCFPSPWEFPPPAIPTMSRIP